MIYYSAQLHKTTLFAWKTYLWCDTWWTFSSQMNDFYRHVLFSYLILSSFQISFFNTLQYEIRRESNHISTLFHFHLLFVTTYPISHTSRKNVKNKLFTPSISSCMLFALYLCSRYVIWFTIIWHIHRVKQITI